MTTLKKEQLSEAGNDDVSDGISQVRRTISNFKIEKPLAQMMFIQTRFAVGGVTPDELVAYRAIYTSIMDTINNSIDNGDSKGSFHIAAKSKKKSFKNKDMMVLVESLTAENFPEIFGIETARAIVEQDESFLNNILCEHLSDTTGCSVVIALSGDIDSDVDKLTELAQLLIRRSVRDVAVTQSDCLKVRSCNPWVKIKQNSTKAETNQLLVNYIDNSSDDVLDLDLLQQILFVTGMLKKTQNKARQELAIIKIAENKRRLAAARMGLPEEQDVYDILPEYILGGSNKPSINHSVSKDVQPNKNPKTITDPLEVSEEISLDKDTDSEDFISMSLSDKSKGFLGAIKNRFNSNGNKNKEKTEKQKEREEHLRRLALLEDIYMSGGIANNKGASLNDILYPNYEKEQVSSFQGIKAIEAILEGALRNKDQISSDELNYSFIDVTAGISVKFLWESNKHDIKKQMI